MGQNNTSLRTQDLSNNEDADSNSNRKMIDQTNQIQELQSNLKVLQDTINKSKERETDLRRHIYDLQLKIENTERMYTPKISESEIKIEKEIGRGAYGEVYKAHYNSIPVVIKKLRDAIYSEHIEKMFENEARMMSIFSHPRIVEFYGLYIFSDKTLGIIMEYFIDDSLHHQLNQKEITRNMMKTIMVDILSALKYLHNVHNAIHGDISSKNILCDLTMNIFKLSVGQSQILTESGAYITGCIAYAAPEVRISHRSTKASDVYAIGVLIVEICTSILVADILEHRLLVRKITIDKLQKLVLKCLSESPEKRPSMGSVLEEVIQCNFEKD